jgi:hypothetical protein
MYSADLLTNPLFSPFWRVAAATAGNDGPTRRAAAAATPISALRLKRGQVVEAAHLIAQASFCGRTRVDLY